MVGSVPTVILFLITLGLYRLLVHVPLGKVLRERYARTQGAVEKAAAAIKIAEEKTREYEQRLREARSAVFRERHERLHNVHIEAELLLADAHEQAQERIADALFAIERGASAVRLQLDGMIPGLTADAVRTVLPGGATAEGRAG